MRELSLEDWVTFQEMCFCIDEQMKDIERQCIGGLICYESNWFDMIWCSVVTSLLFFVVLQEPIRYAPGDPIEAF